VRVLILGLPGSGTSCVAEIYHRAGYHGGRPYFAKGGYPYQTHESLLGRACNRLVLGVSEKDWPSWRWHHDYRPRNPYADPELHALADLFVKGQDTEGDWFFKNPESLLTFQGLWKRYSWDEVIGVYRHPGEAIRTMHSGQQTTFRRAAWNRQCRMMLMAATKVVRFPDDMAALALSMGVHDPYKGQLRRTEIHYDPMTHSWCATRWKELEAKRWTAPATILSA